MTRGSPAGSALREKRLSVDGTHRFCEGAHCVARLRSIRGLAEDADGRHESSL